MDIENDITEEENQSNDKNKTSKIDFRLPTKMKDMVVASAKKQGLKVSQFITNLVESHFEEQAKSDRIRKDREEQAHLKAQQEYAELDKKLKYQRGDFSVDGTDEKIEPEKRWIDLLMNTMIWLFVAGFGWLIVTLFQDKTARKARERYLQDWNLSQNQLHSPFKPIMSDKRSDKSVRH